MEESLTFSRIWWWEICRKSLDLEGFTPWFPTDVSLPKQNNPLIEHPPVVPVACASTIQLQKKLKIPMEFRSSRTIPARTPVTRRKGWATPTIKLPRMIVPKWYPGSQSEVGISTNLSILNHGYLLIYTINQPVYLVICLASILIYIYTLDSYVAYIRSFASLSLSLSLHLHINVTHTHTYTYNLYIYKYSNVCNRMCAFTSRSVFVFLSTIR